MKSLIDVSTFCSLLFLEKLVCPYGSFLFDPKIECDFYFVLFEYHVQNDKLLGLGKSICRVSVCKNLDEFG